MKRAAILVPLTVVALAVVAHAPGLGGAWVYDDHRFIVANASIKEIDVASYFADPSTASASQGIQHDIYRPLRTLSYAVDWRLFGPAPLGWHVHNLLLHVLAALLLLRLLRPVLRGHRLAAAAGATLFAVHPATVECVAWVSSRGDLLAVVLMLVTLLVLERDGVGRTVLGLPLMALACFAKESALVLPALLLLRDFALPTGQRPSTSTTWTRVGLLAVVAVGYLALRLSVIPELAQVTGFPGGSRAAAARGMLSGLTWYASALVWPTGFTFDLHLPVPAGWLDPEVVLGGGLLLTLLAAGAWGLTRPDRRLLTFAAWGALACLVPVSNVVVPLKALVAERFLYPALLCVVAGAAWALLRPPLGRRWIGFAVAGAIVVALVPITWWRASAWKDDLTLWETVLHERPSHMPAYAGLGWEYSRPDGLRRGRLREAENACRSYLDYNPTDGKYWMLLGNLIGEAARSLRLERPRPGVDIVNLDKTRRQARLEQLHAYAQAVRIWQQLGFQRGRGSPEMLRATFGNVLEAAYDAGGARLLDAKGANDELLRMEGVDPADLAAVFERGSFPRRRARLDLAWKLVTSDAGRQLPTERYAAFVKVRSLLLRDLGVDPALSDRDVLRLLLPRYRELAKEPGRDILLELTIVSTLDRLGLKDEAARLHRDLGQRYPGHPLLRAPARRPR